MKSEDALVCSFRCILSSITSAIIVPEVTYNSCKFASSSWVKIISTYKPIDIDTVLAKAELVVLQKP